MNHAKAIDDLITKLRGSYTPEDYRDYGASADGGNDDLAALKGRNVFLTSSVLGMRAISHVIEDQAIALKRPITFYAAFQKFSRIRVQMGRYSRLLENGSTVYLFGEKDTDVTTDRLFRHQHLKLITLPPALAGENAPSLTANWMVLLHDPSFVSMALVTREIPGLVRPRNAPDKLIYRSFEGFWTYDKEVISYLVRVLDDYVVS